MAARSFTRGLACDYGRPLGGINRTMGTTISSQSESLGVLCITNAEMYLYEVNVRTLVSARLGVEAPEGRLAVFGWGRNIFNKYYWTNTIQTYDTVVRYAGRPAEYGLTVRFKFQ